MGVAHVPEDRMRDGLIGAMTVAENFILDTYHREPYSDGIRLNREAINAGAATAVKDYDVRTPGIETYAGSLSGGNQQKVVVAREFSRAVKLVIAAQPTRGLDVGSIEYIHKRMVEQRDKGAAVLIISTELDEVLAVGDRVAVIQGGQIVGVVEGEDATYENLGMLMGGVRVTRLRTTLRHGDDPDPRGRHRVHRRVDRHPDHRLREPEPAAHRPDRCDHRGAGHDRHGVLLDADRRVRRPGADRGRAVRPRRRAASPPPSVR